MNNRKIPSHTNPRTNLLSIASFVIISICSIMRRSRGFPGRLTVNTASVTIPVKWSANYRWDNHIRTRSVRTYILGKLCAERSTSYTVEELAVILNIFLGFLQISQNTRNLQQSRPEIWEFLFLQFQIHQSAIWDGHPTNEYEWKRKTSFT